MRLFAFSAAKCDMDPRRDSLEGGEVPGLGAYRALVSGACTTPTGEPADRLGWAYRARKRYSEGTGVARGSVRIQLRIVAAANRGNAESCRPPCLARRLELICFYVVVGWLLIVATPAFADQWGPPLPEHWSANGKWVLKVTRSSLDTHKRIALWRRGEFEPAWIRSCADLGGPPHRAYVADDGRHVVLRDVHGELGRGTCIAFLGTEGEILRAYELHELLTDFEILNTKSSLSSNWWSQPGWFTLRDGDHQFALVSSKGTIRCFDTATGAPLAVGNELRARIISEASADGRQWLSNSDPWWRIDGAKLLGLLGSKENVAALTAAFESTGASEPGDLWQKPWETERVRAVVAQALVRLIGGEAMPWVEPVLKAPFSHSRTRLLESMIGRKEGATFFPGLRRSPISRDLWQRLAQDSSPEVQSFALVELLDDRDGAFLREHLELLYSAQPRVRQAAIQTLSEHATTEELPRLRELLGDSDNQNDIHAWRALVRLDPPDVAKLLAWGRQHEVSWLRLEAHIESARRGDPQSIEELMCRIRALGNHAHDRAGWAEAEFQAEKMCRLVAESNLSDAQASLRVALENECTDLRRPVAGALAALGDDQALEILRGMAQEGHALDRASAIRWLGRAGDMASLGLLSSFLEDEEPWVREAAAEAIELLELDSD